MLVHDARSVIGFLEAVFGAEAGRQFEGPDGSIMHAEVHIDDSIVMLADATAEWKPLPSMIHVYVKDVDAIYQRALDQGAIAEQEPASREGDPDRRGGFRDPAGNTWWVSTQMPTAS
jgi:uncharacterized glyoxalase superfamily protein PhnB